MRLWLRPEERRPNPEPVPTRDARALLVGCAAWLLVLVVLLIVTATGGAVRADVLATVVIGLLLGTLGLYAVRGRR